MERITAEQQDAIDDVFYMVKRRAYEQLTFAGFMKACLANGGITEARVQPFINALNEETKSLWRAWWKAFNLGLCKRPTPGVAPQVKFNANLKCDGRCQNATGYHCECSCAGSGHGLLNIRLYQSPDPAGVISNLKNMAKEEMREINANPFANLSIQANKYVR